MTDPLSIFSFLRDSVFYVCRATNNAEMTNLIANYLVNKGFYNLGPKDKGTPQAHKDQFEPILEQMGLVLFCAI